MRPGERAIAGVDDSKELTALERRRLAKIIRERALCLALGAASAREIDTINIYQATALAMRRALARLAMRPDHILVDGRPIASLQVEHTAVVGGDGRCFHIACASIIAKVTRDRLLTSLAARHPVYAWERNAGYTTPEHVNALRHAGPTAHHCRSFVVGSLGPLPPS